MNKLKIIILTAVAGLLINSTSISYSLAQESVSNVAGHVKYTIVSPGEDGRGAHDIQGNEIAPCDTSSLAGENCDMNDGTFYTAPKSTAGNDNDFSHNIVFEGSNLAYSWHFGEWGTCNGQCVSGTQTRTVTCRDRQGVAVSTAEESDQDKCGHTTKPDTVQNCPLGPCRWLQSPWGACQGVCFSGTQTRSINCTNASGGTASNANLCNGSQPATSRVCSLPNCRWRRNAASCPAGSSTTASSGGGGGGGGGSVLCGYFFNKGVLSSEIYQGDLAFADNFIGESTKRGYRLWAVPLTAHLNNNPGGLAEKIVEPFVVSWAQEMAFRTGHASEGHSLGKVLLWIAKPVVSFIGNFVEDTEWKNLKSEQEISDTRNTREDLENE